MKQTFRLLTVLLGTSLALSACQFPGPPQPTRAPFRATQSTGGQAGRPVTTNSATPPEKGPSGTAPPPSAITPAVPPVPPVVPPVNGTGAQNSQSSLFGSVAAPAEIVSNNGSGIISNNGSAIIANNGSGIIGNNGSGIISNNGSAIISNNGSAYRVLDASSGNRLLTNAFMYLTNRDEKFYRNTETNQAFTATTDAQGNFAFQASLSNGFPYDQDVIVDALVNGDLRLTGYMLPSDSQPNELHISLGTTLATEYLRGEAYRTGNSLSSYDNGLFEQIGTLNDQAIGTGAIAAVSRKTTPTDGKIASSSVTVGNFDLRLDQLQHLRNQYVVAISAVDQANPLNAIVRTISDDWKQLLGYRPYAVTTILGNGAQPQTLANPTVAGVQGDERTAGSGIASLPYSAPGTDPTTIPAGFVYGVACDAAGDTFLCGYTPSPGSGNIRWIKPDGTVTSVWLPSFQLGRPSSICVEKAPVYDANGTMTTPGTLLVVDNAAQLVFRIWTLDTPTYSNGQPAYPMQIVCGEDTAAYRYPDGWDYNHPGIVNNTINASGYPYWGPAVDGATPDTSRWRLAEEGSPTYASPTAPIPNPATYAHLNRPMAVCTDELGNIYIADTGNMRVRMIPAVAGNYYKYRTPVEDPKNPGQILVDAQGHLINADGTPNTNYATMQPGHIYTIAGNPRWVASDTVTPNDGTGRWFGQYANSDGMPAQEAKLDQPDGLAFYNGSLYISDYDNQRVRVVSRADGVIHTYAGNPPLSGDDPTYGQRGLGPDRDYIPGTLGLGGPATQAQLAYPRGLAFDKSGRLYIADTASGRILMVGLDHTVSDVAGRVHDPNALNAPSDDYTDGDALNWADLFETQYLSVDKDGNLVFADLRHERVRKVWRQWE